MAAGTIALLSPNGHLFSSTWRLALHTLVICYIIALGASIGNVSRFVAGQGMDSRTSAPALLVGLIASIAERFGIVLPEKAAAELVPVLGVVGGAFVNGVFIQHFQDMAWSRFTIRRLERKYIPVQAQAEYEKLVRTQGKL